MLSRLYQDEIRAVIKQWPVWAMLGMQDIKLRYRRSSIGPFWITISMAVTILSMGFLYSHLFHSNLKDYFPYLAAGIICWAFFSTLIIESTGCYIESENYIRNQESYMLLFGMRIVLRNTVILLHNLVVLIPILCIFHVSFHPCALLFIPAVLLVALNAVWWGGLFALLGTRFLDVTQIITSLVQVVFFITPVMWMPSLLSDRIGIFLIINPFYHLLTLMRDPLLGKMWPTDSFLIVCATTLTGFLLHSFCLTRYKNRIVFWL